MKFTNIIQKFPSVCEFYWNNHWKKGKVMYKFETGTELRDVRDVFTLPDFSSPNITEVAKAIRLTEQTDDKVALACLRYVIAKILYKSDEVVWNKSEKWQVASQTFKKETGDCEDMSLLLMELLKQAGIPAWRRKIACGDALDPIGKWVGHAYVLYLTDDFVWTTLDAAYYPLNSIAGFGDPHSQLANYGDIWFTFNESNSWHQKSTLFMY